MRKTIPSGDDLSASSLTTKYISGTRSIAKVFYLTFCTYYKRLIKCLKLSYKKKSFFFAIWTKLELNTHITKTVIFLYRYRNNLYEILY